MNQLVIIGGGIAGLSLGYFAMMNGFSFKVIEANTRLGGRIFKYKNDSFSTDLGAEFIGSYHSSILNLCNTLKINISENIRNDSFSLPEKIFYQNSFLSNKKRGALEREMDHLIDELIQIAQPVNPYNPYTKSTKTYDQISIEEWLKLRKASNELQKFFTDLDSSKHSMLALLSMIAGSGGKELFLNSEAYFITEGSDTLINALKNQFPENILCDSSVLEIYTTPKGCKLICYNSQGKCWIEYASKVIVAIPASCLPNLCINGKFFSSTAVPEMSNNRTVSISFDNNVLLEELFIVTDQCNRLIAKGASNGKEYAEIKVHVCPHFTTPVLDLVNSTLKICGIFSAGNIKMTEMKWENNKWAKGSYPFYPTNYFSSGNSFQDIYIHYVMFAGDYVIPGYAGFMEGAVRSSEIVMDKLKSSCYF